MSSRYAPPQGPPPSYAFVGRVYQRNLRPVVVFSSFMSGIWALVWGIGALRVIGFDKHNIPGLAIFAIILGIFYMVTAATCGLGLFAAYTQRLPVIRLFSLAAPVAVLLVIAAGFIRIVTHFTFKTKLINTCTTQATGETIFFSWGVFGGVQSQTLNGEDAHQLCTNAFDHDSWAEIVSLLIEIVLGLLFISIAYSYYRQSLDPTFSRTVAGPERVRMDVYPSDDRAYHASAQNVGFAPPAGPPPGQGGFAPPSGPPPTMGYGASELPKYDGKGIAGDDKDSKENPFADFDEADRK